jgi:outer membrane protein
MKNGVLVLNVVLLLAVAVLFYLHFSSGKNGNGPVVKSASRNDAASGNSFKIAYFEMDSIENAFVMVKDVTKELNVREQSLMNDLQRMEKALYDKASEYQSKANTMSQTESEMATNDMAQRRKTFEDQKAKYQQDYQSLSFRKTNEIKQAIKDYLAEYNKTRGYSYIMSNEAGFMYYKDTIYDITGDLIKGLNENYSKKK